MKRFLFSLLVLLGLSATTFAQHQKVVLTLKDGTKMFWTVSEIDSLSIADPDDPSTAKVGEPVDLGLSVQWSDINLGADTPEDLGYLVSWGDPTGTDQNPSLAPMTSIVGTQYDIATALWKDEWRLPSDNDIKELISKCSWSFDSQRNGWKVQGANGNSIFLPLPGLRDGNVITQQGREGYYWSGILESQENAGVLKTTLTEHLFAAVKYSLGCAVRPVKGAYHPGVTKVSAVWTGGDETTATFNLALEGTYLENVTDAGIVYSTSLDDLTSAGTRATVKELVGTGNTSATYTLTGLEPGTLYYYMGYAVYDGSTTTYSGSYDAFLTDELIIPVTVTTQAATAVGATSATLAAEVSGTSLDGVTELGIVWGTSEGVTLDTGEVLKVAGLPASHQVSFTVKRLNKGNRYYFRGYAKTGEGVVYGEERLVNTKSSYGYPSGVDLGVSVIWADRNMGADERTHPGVLVGWGDVTGAAPYTNLDFYPSNNDIIGTDHDPATQLLSSVWRMPSDDEINELLTHCTWVWTTESDGTQGFRVSGNGNSIFLPVTGQREGKVYSAEDAGYYWSGIGDADVSGNARALEIKAETSHDLVSLKRFIGAAIRPVSGAYGVVVRASTSEVGTTTATIAIALDGKLDNITSYGVKLGQSASNLTDKYEGTDEPTSMMTLTLTGLSDQTTYYYQAYVIEKGVERTSEVMKFTTEKIMKEPDAIDLGLSVKWSDINLGANNEYEAGWLLGWGDITHEATSTGLASYPIANPGGDLVNTMYDVALQAWGGDWRMPTEAEFQELIDNCDWTPATVNRSDGWRVTSRTDPSKSIFLPLTGRREGTTTNYYGNGYYWTGTLDRSNEDNARAFVFETNQQMPTAQSLRRSFGMAVRPVQGDYNVAPVVAVDQVTNPDASSATVPVVIGGDFKKISKWGLLCTTNSTPTLNDEVDGGTQVPALGSFLVDVVSLTPGSTYYYQAYIVTGDQTLYSEVLTFTTKKNFPDPGTPIDLGLSVKWAPWNIGASKVGERGAYLGWGDTEINEATSNGFHAVGNTHDNISGTEYDVAYENWGHNWRMPTVAEVEELATRYRQYTSNYVDENGVSTGVPGYVLYAVHLAKVVERLNTDQGIVDLRNDIYLHLSDSTKILKSECAKIFLPSVGYKYNGTVVTSGTDAIYWTSEASVRGTSSYALQMSNSNYTTSSIEIKMLLCVRPVYDDGSSSGDDPNPVQPETAEAGKAVDLGLSVQWATCNIGAVGKLANDEGDYLAWAELEPKYSYVPETSPYWDPDATHPVSHKKGDYIRDPEVFEDIKGDTLYDAAAARWRGQWRLPSQEEMQELIDKCTWTRTTMNGVEGVEVKSKVNNSSIFLPLAGYRSGTVRFQQGEEGRFWTSTLYTRSTNRNNLDAYQLDVTSTAGITYAGRELGCSVRPVCPLSTNQAARRKARMRRSQ